MAKTEKSLVIVESPAKAATISRFLGKNFSVESSYGHIRDLPKSKLGIDLARDFEPQYVIPRAKAATVKKLRQAAQKAEKIILATDEDREGEAIAWHLVRALKLDGCENEKEETKNVERIAFHEITENAVKEALKKPRRIYLNLVNAQQARRILDRLVGYNLSPFLWKKIYRGLSAGRVQSVALRLIAEREREIEKFKPQEYWTIEATLQKNAPAGENAAFSSYLTKINGEALDKFFLKNENDAEKITEKLKNCAWLVESAEKRAVSKNPLPPFTTSTLQQEAFRRLGFSAKQTMMFAQQLYEGVELEGEPTGLITYMRTDSVALSEESVKEARKFLEETLGKNYLSPLPRKFKTKSKNAQEAHEAVRPTSPRRAPETLKKFLNEKQYKLYELIWKRFTAAQMPEAVFDSTTVDIAAAKKDGGKFTFRASGQTMKFNGFLKIYPMKFSEIALPELVPGENLKLAELKPEKHFTEPPPRFNEATLVKILEKYGIGRPSTYAPIISTIQERGYAEKYEKRRLKPTESGFLVNDLLVEHFPEIVDVNFTAKMEEELDEIASGQKKWQPVIREFYEPFERRLKEKYEKVEKLNLEEKTNETCEKCGKPMVIKMGRFGKFLACSGFPECKNAKPIKREPQIIGMKCPKCLTGEIAVRTTRKKRIFYGCLRYPECDYASWKNPKETGEQTET